MDKEDEVEVEVEDVEVEEDDDGGLEAQLQAEKKRNEELAAALEKSRSGAERLAGFVADRFMAGRGEEPSRPKPQASQAEEAEPDREEDPEGWMDWRIRQGVEKGVAAAVGPLARQYEADRGVLLSTAEATARGRAVEQFGERFTSRADKVEAYLDQFSPEAKANPQAWAEAFYRVLGQEAAADRGREVATRPGVGEAGRGRPSASTRRITTEAASAQGQGVPDDPRAQRTARVFQVDPDEWGRLSGRMTVDQYAELKETRETKAKKKKRRG